MLTPSPKMSPSSTITSPRLMPIRNWIHRAGASALRRPSGPGCRRRTATASATLWNSTSMPSPVVLTMRPVVGDRGIDELEAMRLEPRERSRLVDFHEPAVADHVGRQNGRQRRSPPTCDSITLVSLKGRCILANDKGGKANRGARPGRARRFPPIGGYGGRRLRLPTDVGGTSRSARCWCRCSAARMSWRVNPTCPSGSCARQRSALPASLGR